ncbi:hypothetical protein HZS_811 [Henneguya salminicola]|nr:hypothetical protein HZS_811 [Henneguya salminicola]
MALIKVKFSLINTLNGSIGLLYLGNFQCQAVINQFTLNFNVLLANKEVKNVTITFSMMNKSFYIRRGLKLVFKCQSHIFVGTVLNIFP